MNERERLPDKTEESGGGDGCLFAFIITIAVIVALCILFYLSFGGEHYCGTGAFFENVAAFQEKFAPVMAFPAYYPEGFDWRGHEDEWFEYKDEMGKVYFNWNTYKVKSDRTRMYANGTFNNIGKKYQTRKDLDIYWNAEIGVSLQYPEGGAPDAWLFYVGMNMLVNPQWNGSTPVVEETRAILRGGDHEFRFSVRQWENGRIGEEIQFLSLSYALPFEGRYYYFSFGVWINPELSENKQDRLYIKMKQRCLEEAVKMYDSLEYLENAGR